MVERGGDWCACSMARAVSPTAGRQVRKAAMTESQKEIASLSNASRESQAQGVLVLSRSTSPTAASFVCSTFDAATHAESSVVLPLPAEAEMSVNGKERAISSSLSKRSRTA